MNHMRFAAGTKISRPHHQLEVNRFDKAKTNSVSTLSHSFEVYL